MEKRTLVLLVVVFGLMLLPGVSFAGGRYDGNWVTHLACEAHGETPAYKWSSPAQSRTETFKDSTAKTADPATL